MATEAVYQYLKTQIRPYCANDIVQNLHKKFGKTAVQKALDQLTQDNKILEKINGKQKVYCILREDSVNANQINQDKSEIEGKITAVQGSINTKNEKLKIAETQEKFFQDSLTMEQAYADLERSTEVVERLQTKLKDLQENNISIPTETKEKIEKDHDRLMKIYRKRKQICMGMVNTILEGYPKSKKDLLEEAGVETDEDVGCIFSKCA